MEFYQPVFMLGLMLAWIIMSIIHGSFLGMSTYLGTEFSDEGDEWYAERHRTFRSARRFGDFWKYAMQIMMTIAFVFAFNPEVSPVSSYLYGGLIFFGALQLIYPLFYNGMYATIWNNYYWHDFQTTLFKRGFFADALGNRIYDAMAKVRLNPWAARTYGFIIGVMTILYMFDM